MRNYTQRRIKPHSVVSLFNGATTALRDNVSQAIRSLSSHNGQQQDLISLTTMLGNVHVLLHPDLVTDFASKPDVFQKPPFLRRIMSVFRQTGILSSEFEDWKRHKELIQPRMAKKHLMDYEPNVAPKVDALLKKWKEQDGVHDLFGDIRKYTFSILCEAVLGVEVDEELEEKLGNAFDTINLETPKNVVLSPLAKLFNVPFSKKFTDAKDFIMAFLDTVCEPYLESHNPGHLPSDILESVGYYENRTHENKCRAYEQIFHIFIAGFETTANTLVWILSEYARRPEWQDVTAKELSEYTENPSGVGMNDLRNLKVQKSFIDEVLRLYAPIYLSFPRVASSNMKLGNEISIKKGDVVFISIDAIHRDPRWWPDPEAFDPNRHQTKSTTDRPKNSYLPFYIGGHTCTGKLMFNMEALPLISGLVANYKLQLKDGQFPERMYKTIMTAKSSSNAGLTLEARV